MVPENLLRPVAYSWLHTVLFSYLSQKRDTCCSMSVLVSFPFVQHLSLYYVWNLAFGGVG